MGTPPVNQSQSGLAMPQISNGPRIKAEPGVESPHGISQPSPYQPQIVPTLQNASTAQQRAAAHLHQSYGPRAAASINAIQSGGQPQQNGTPTMQQMQMMQQRAALAQAQAQGQSMHNQRPQMTQEQYQRMMQQNAANQLAQQQARQNGQHPQPQNPNGQNGQNGYQGPPQTDGPGDEEQGFGVIKQGDEVMGRVEIDNMIRTQIESMGRHMEGGGLMLPLRQLPPASQRRNRKGKGVDRGNAQMDGGDDDDVKNEELDEDAINSDLDDPDEGLNDEEDEDEGMGHIMLCMYDKVQRVKNKWYVPPSPFVQT